MSDRNRWAPVPRTPVQAALNIVIGLALAAQAVIVLATTTVTLPALETIVAVLGGALVVCGVIGLISRRAT